jgi:hypothetical protein
MTCDEFESAIFDDIDGSLSPQRQADLGAHRVACARCSEFARQARNLDGMLSEWVATPSLPSNFERRLHAQIRRERMELEFADGLKRLKKGWWNWPELTESICDAIVASFLAAGLIAAFPFLRRNHTFQPWR